MSLASQVTLLAERVANEFKSVRSVLGTPAVLSAGSTITISKSGGTWPGSPTTRSDVVIIWKGADPSPPIVQTRTLNQPGMLDNVDIRLVI